jgi:threonyl-tRNA synthetase
LDPNEENGEANHVEIITVSQEQNSYAEWIESRLKAVGFRVDLLFPNEDVALNKVLGSIKCSGVRYAILVTAEHEHNNSMTVYVSLKLYYLIEFSFQTFIFILSV